MGESEQAEPVDPLHSASPPGQRWTTRNFAEAMPGVPTALSWSIWGPGMQYAAIQVYRWMGVFSGPELDALERLERRASDVFFGHVAGNVDVMSVAVARTPGGSPSTFERDFFGIEPGARTPPVSRRRWPVIVPRLVALRRQHPLRLRRLAVDTEGWWRSSLASRPSPEAGRALLDQAAERFKWAMAVHSLQSSLAQAAFSKAAKISARSDAPGAELELVTGSGELEELHVARDLWQLAHGKLDLPQFLARHGYHGPNEGELSSHSWREDHGPVTVAIDAFKARAEDESPDEQVRRKAAHRSTAIARVTAGKHPLRASLLRRSLDKAARDVAHREVGKAAFLKTLDVARFAARAIGADLAERGLLDDPNEVFHLTIGELRNFRGGALRELVANRAAQRDRYLQLALPEYWVGDPTPIELAARPARTGSLAGLPASGGTAEGRARVIVDIEDDPEPLGPDEILVASTTDPGWLSLFMGAAGMVVDVGGPMSHAAIVARELGIPCVINTVDGTRRVHTGDRLRIDGDAGTVDFLDPAN